MIRFQFWHNATAMITIDDQRVLCDPWLVPACPPFMSWIHWPTLPDDIIEQVGDCDVIWISHCHEDHYHLPTLRAYMRRWGDKPICTRTMQERAVADGFRLGVIENSVIFVAENGIDSSIAMLDKEGNSIVNLTDVHYEQKMIDGIKRWCNGSPTVALIPFAGAGPWPQTYYDDPEVLAVKAKEKQAMFVERYLQFRDALKPKVCIPFAGQYALGGALAHLNKWRGMNDAVDMPGSKLVFWIGGVFTHPFVADGMRTRRLPDPPGGFDFLNDEDPKDLYRLCEKAAAKVGVPRKIKIRWSEHSSWLSGPQVGPSYEVTIDPRLLKRLLTGQMHWADADAGSLYKMRREPDVYDKAVMDWLWSFHV